MITEPTLKPKVKKDRNKFLDNFYLKTGINPPQFYEYTCDMCKIEFTVTGFNPTKCKHCGLIVCLNCLNQYQTPEDYTPDKKPLLTCWRCRLNFELTFIEKIAQDDLLLHVNREWCTKKGEDAFLRRLGIL